MMTAIKIDASRIKSQERLDKISRTQMEMHTVLNSSIFRDQVYKIKKHGERSKYKDYTNAQIYAILMQGSEEHKPGIDYIWDIFVAGYFSWKRVIGYMTRGSKLINMNTRYFDARTTKLIGSTITHEQGHHLGFSHDFRRTKDRPFSICYQLNICYEYAYYKLFGQQLNTVQVCTRSWKSLWLIKSCRWKEIYE